MIENDDGSSLNLRRKKLTGVQDVGVGAEQECVSALLSVLPISRATGSFRVEDVGPSRLRIPRSFISSSGPSPRTFAWRSLARR